MLTPFYYLVVGLASLLLAVFIASKIVRPSYSQEEEVPPPPPTQTAEAAAPAAAATSAEAAQMPPADLNAMGSATSTAVPSDVPFLEPYIFDTREGRRNPFRPPVQADGSMPDIMLPGTPLERYELDELKLVGIMWEVKAPKAMIIDPLGEVHVLGKDDRVGRKRGYIAVIREGEVVVVETTTFNGETAYSTRVMRIEK
jgi:type IV pilus assembly protein PilP